MDERRRIALLTADSGTIYARRRHCRRTASLTGAQAGINQHAMKVRRGKTTGNNMHETEVTERWTGAAMSWPAG